MANSKRNKLIDWVNKPSFKLLMKDCATSCLALNDEDKKLLISLRKAPPTFGSPDSRKLVVIMNKINTFFHKYFNIPINTQKDDWLVEDIAIALEDVSDVFSEENNLTDKEVVKGFRLAKETVHFLLSK